MFCEVRIFFLEFERATNYFVSTRRLQAHTVSIESGDIVTQNVLFHSK